jgi:intraflagellar transport protein 172
MTWPKDRSNELIFAEVDGKIRMGVLKSNKSHSLYSGESYCLSLASSRDGATVISGHLDGSVYAFSMENQSFKKIFTHHCVPYSLGFG